MPSPGVPITYRITTAIKEILTIFVRRVVSIAVAIALLVGLSFLFFGEFSFPALSERLVWTGIGIALVGGILVFGQTVGGRNYGLPGMFTRSVHANDLINFNIEVRKSIDKKFDFTIQLFFIGVLVFGFGALINVIWG
jgi:hypothetical protein